MALLRYLTQYRFRDMGELIRNEKREPLPCGISLENKKVILSGATSGIGLETARLFASKGAELVCLNRNPEKSETLEKELKDKFKCKIRTIITDFSSLKKIKDCIDELMKIKNPMDIIIHNSGVYHTKKTFTEDGIEMVFQVNHLASFLITYMLKEKISKENRARIIYVNSEGYRFALAGVHLQDLSWKRHLYTGLKSYGAAKTAQLLTMQKFSEFFAGSSVTVNAMHPGNVKSNIGNNNGKLYRYLKNRFILNSAKEPGISAKALYYLSASPDLNGVSGKFFNLTTEEKTAPHIRDSRKAEEVWQKSLELCGIS